MRTIKTVRLILGLDLLILISSWGFLVHRTINQLAIYQLPTQMQPFFHANMESLVRNSVAPDLRRNADSLEEARHYIDFEAYGDSAAWKMPMDWKAAVKKYSRDTLMKYGYVPYHIQVIKGRLTQAFRSRNRDSILFYAADLAHYISDAHVPLHTSLNYDGQLTGQKGLHSLWESTVPELHITEYNLFTNHKARYLSNSNKAVWQAVREAHLLLNDVFGQEKAVSSSMPDSVKYRIQVRDGRESKRYSTAFAKEYAKRLGTTVNGQLLKSSQMVADFWYTCWMDGGKPDLGKLFKATAESKQKMAEEQKAFKENKLIEKKLLISRQPAPREE